MVKYSGAQRGTDDNVMRRMRITCRKTTTTDAELSIYFCLICFGLSFSPSSEAGVQLRQGFKSAGYGVSQWRADGGGLGVEPPSRNSEVLPKMSRIPSSVEYTSVTT
jgi:hypothetical protein